ncbi:LOW QUALITY PROTEIN: melanoma-associated antigen 10-like [Peromyscus californicus insignis]|uniref:LOW QUALITY PROTEIN: melanoma-associated antigen 10-like n=1 Tax=Peromyscus californicus insignis TaxID=564181 RepID=UPI0022A7084A|nr:LOW QUALITY PROTEIN: melanoma-associated antigen 10-like [Peromyscus californicus insignis]
MDPTENSQSFNLPDSTRSHREARGLECAQVPIAEVGEAEANATISGAASVGRTLSSLQSAQRASSPPTTMGSIAGAPPAEASHNQAKEVAHPESSPPPPPPPPQDALNRKVVDLVLFLLLKYRRKQLTTRAEILHMVVRDYEAQYPVIFTKASDCMRLMFGLDIIERNPRVHSYSLVYALGITYDGMQHGFPGIPKTGLVIVMLCIIFIKDNCVSEEVLWQILNNMGLYARREHFIYGEPRRLITEHFVQEGYLEYRQVPDSDPPSHEFLWGPRAHAETTKMKVLRFFASVVKQDPRSYPFSHAEALRDEIERT